MVLVIHPEYTHLFPAMVGVALRLRNFAGHADRRRGHADGHLTAELVRRFFGRAAGIRAQQQSSGGRGRARWLLRFHSLRDHVQGHESLVHQRDVRRVRAGPGNGRSGRPKNEPFAAPSPEEAAAILSAASKVAIVPGYGMAVAQAQHKVRELYDALTKRGIDVKFGIHPVAGACPAT